MDLFTTQVKKSCNCNRCVVVVLAILVVALVVALAVHGSICTKSQTCEQTCNPESTEPLVQKLVAQEKINGIVLLVDYENTLCKDNFCSVCHTDVLLHQNHSITIPCPESINNRGCPNCTVLLTKGGETEIECPENGYQDAKCLAEHTCREEQWCNEGFPVIKLTSETTWKLICQCPAGKKGPRCEENLLSTFRCDCYSSPLILSGWSVLPRCDKTFPEEPNFCRLKVVDNSTNTEKQCACAKSDKNQTDIEAECAVAPSWT